MLQIEHAGLSDHGPCECCNSMSRLAAGFIYCDGQAHAGYQVHWTLGQIARHGATFYLILGRWGAGTAPADRIAVAVHYRQDTQASGFMVVDADQTQIASNPLVGRALCRAEVVGIPLAQEVFELVDLIWLQDERISEISQSGNPG